MKITYEQFTADEDLGFTKKGGVVEVKAVTKEFCCEDLKKVWCLWTITFGNSGHLNTRTEVYIVFDMGSDDEPDTKYFPIAFCPFCGKEITVTGPIRTYVRKNEEVVNTWKGFKTVDVLVNGEEPPTANQED